MGEKIDGPSLPEAPVSWTVRYRSVQGFDAMLTLRGTDPIEVLKIGGDLMARMAAAGCTPTGYNGNGHGASNGNGETKPCPAHPGEELRKHTKDG